MFNYSKIPQEMKNTKRWVLWKLKKTDDGRTTKIPINANSGYGAKSNDESTWVSFDEALSKVSYFNCNGLGFMLGNGYFGVDIDHAIDNTDLINEFIDTLKSYTERSQSGEGIHIICKGVLPSGNRRKGNIEMYDNARFFAMTGDTMNDYDIAERTEQVKPLWEKYLNDKPSEKYVYYNENAPRIKQKVFLTDEQVIQKASESKNGALFNCLFYGQWEGIYKSQSEADAGFCSLLAFWTNKDKNQMDSIFRKSGLYRDKWNQKRGQSTYGEITIESAISHCKSVYEATVDDKTRTYNPDTGEVFVKKDYDLNDTGNAQRFIDRFGSGIKYNFDNKCWVIWNGKTWIRDGKQLVKTKVDLLIEEMKEEAIKEPNEMYSSEMLKNVKRLSSNSGKEAMLKEAMHIGDTPTLNSDYDKEKWLLNCNNGIVDLKTGKLLPHDRKYMMAKNTNVDVDFEKEPKVWVKCLGDIFDNDEETIKFIKKAIGYTLTGSTREQCLFQCSGDGSNGKSVFFDTIYNMLGDYSLNAQVESVLTRANSSSGNATPDIARMKGARFVRTNEPNQGARFNEGFVKQLTGDSVVTARFLYGSDFEFTPEFKLWIATNYPIEIRGTDKGIKRRMRLIRFDKIFEGDNADKDIFEKILMELPSILGWAIKGCLEYQKEGLEPSKSVENATQKYFEDNDIVEKFVVENLKKSKYGKEKASDVFIAYKTWAKNNNEWDGMTQSKFGKELSKRFEKKNIGGYVYYYGVILKKNDESYVYEKEK